MNSVKSNIIGTLQQDGRLPNWYKSRPVTIPFFKYAKIEIVYAIALNNPTNFSTQADAILANFLQKTNKDRLQLSKTLYDDCQLFLHNIGHQKELDTLYNIKHENEIWNFITPKEIRICNKKTNSSKLYVQILCDCEWDYEHGLQFIFLNGNKLVRISEIDGCLTLENE